MKIQIREFNAETGKITDTERELSAEEIALIKQEEEMLKQHQMIIAEKAAARQAVLDKLGLSADEVAALLG